jgi:hypothetical protein
VNVRVNTLGKLQRRMEVLGSVVGKTRLTYFEASLYKFDMSILKCIIYNPFVLLD